MEKEDLHLSDKQKEILKQFRIDLEDYLTPAHTDKELLKWLRVRNFNLKKAEDNFREVLCTRIFYGINTITDTLDIPEVLQKYRGDTFLGFAKDGSPIRYIKLAVDYRGFLHSISTYHLVLYFCYLLEIDTKAREEGYKKTGKKSDGIMYIVDMEGLSIQNFSYKIVIETGLDSMRLYQDHYPESWGNVFFVNAPSIFGAVLNIFKPILKDTLLGRLRATSKETSPEVLRQYVDKDVLPAFLGGSRVDSKGDPYCKEFINQGGMIPEKYYLKNSTNLIQETDPGVEVATIAPRSVHNVSMVLRKAPAKYRFQMRTENGGIYVTVLYRKFGPDPENVDLPSSDEYLDPHDPKCNVKMVGTRLRSQSHCAPNDGYCVFAYPGIYITQFDNTDSWFTSKKLLYRVSTHTLDQYTKRWLSDAGMMQES